MTTMCKSIVATWVKVWGRQRRVPYRMKGGPRSRLMELCRRPIVHMISTDHRRETVQSRGRISSSKLIYFMWPSSTSTAHSRSKSTSIVINQQVKSYSKIMKMTNWARKSKKGYFVLETLSSPIMSGLWSTCWFQTLTSHIKNFLRRHRKLYSFDLITNRKNRSLPSKDSNRVALPCFSVN